MQRTFGTVLRHALIGATLVASTLVLSGANASASSVKVNEAANALPLCGVVKSKSVRVSSKNECVVRVLLGANVRFVLGSGYRWGDPVSTSRDVVVTTVSRNSIGVDGATVRAAKLGRATVQVTGVVWCKAGVACPDLALLWRLDVIVVKTFS
jgi:hypothetical protein